MTGSVLREIAWATSDELTRSKALERPAVRVGPEISAAVAGIIASVRRGGDTELIRLTAELDGVRLDSLRVTDDEAAAARTALSPAAIAALETAIGNVRRFHEAQALAPVRVETAPGVVCEGCVRPIRAVGLYVPAGSAPLPSTAIMLSVPADLAACPVRVMCTPPRRDGLADPAVVTVARSCGIAAIFKVGGAQAIAAMAYGTASIPKVDKIFGPGNAWVTAAKQSVAADPGGAALDMPAGPSEVMVVADADADPRFVALDLLAQAEHGPDSQVILVTDDPALSGRVQAAIADVLPRLSRRNVIGRALAHSIAVLVTDIGQAIEVANRYAPEHLILQVAEPRRWVAQVQAAGSVFLGPWTPESVGDYCSGTNHVLPTYGYARAYSGLAVTDFQRRMTLQELTRPGLVGLAPTVETLAGLEGLDAHAEAVRVRLAAEVA
jgi:histidinol dehydrogenase